MVLGVRPLIDIGYRYNARKVICFIVTEDSGSKKVGIPYLFKYPDPFYNVSVCPFDRPIFMSKFFVSVNKVDSHNKSRQSGLLLDNFWVTHCGWLRSCTAVAMGMTITNFCKIFRYGVKRYHYEKLIGIR